MRTKRRIFALARTTSSDIYLLSRRLGAMLRILKFGAAMLEHLPKDIREALEAAHRLAARRSSRLRLHAGDSVYPILRAWEGGFALAGDSAPNLRGLVDVHDGARHLWQCLIVASREENGEIICEFKRNTVVTDRPARDFPVADDAPAALLPRP